MARVFVSYAHQDCDHATALHAWLQRKGHDVFRDDDPEDGIKGGDDWEHRLLEEISAADIVICIISADYIRSPWCVSEVAVAHVGGKRLVPVLVDDTHVAAVPLLSRRQFIPWSDDDAAFERLGTALQELETRRYGLSATSTSPFPGLLPFDETLAWAYAGRVREVQQLADTLRSPAPAAGRMVVVVGPSGSGKSSLIRAGVAADLADDPGWLVLPTIVPGDNPLRALAGCLTTASRAVGISDLTTSSARCPVRDAGTFSSWWTSSTSSSRFARPGTRSSSRSCWPS
jgi:hypothetical protein